MRILLNLRYGLINSSHFDGIVFGFIANQEYKERALA